MEQDRPDMPGRLTNSRERYMKHVAAMSGTLALSLAACGGLGSAPSVPSGTTITATATSPLSSATNRPGDAIQVRVTRDVMAADGKTVVIPVGSVVTLDIAQIGGAKARGEKGTLVMTAKQVEIAGKSYSISAGASNYQYEMKAHNIGVSEVAKTGVGAAVGAVVGHAVGGDVGTVVGGVGGGVVGAEIAAKDIDHVLVVHTAATVTLTLKQDFVRK